MKEIAIKIRLDQVEAKKRAVELTQEISKLQAKQKELNALNKGSAINNKLLATGINNTKIALQQKRAELTKVNGVIKANDNSLGGLRAKNAQLHAQIEKVNTSTKAGQARFKTLSTEIGRNQTQINKLDASMKRYQGNVGNYSGVLGGLSGSLRTLAVAFGFTGAIYMFVNALKEGVKTIIAFEKENAVLAGVLNKQQSQIQALTEDAIKLGGIYPTLASEVTQLQISYARLGFSQEEILALTKDTIEGSLALNSALDATATLVGAVVRTFDDLEATDAKEIIDKLTISTQRSSLSFEKLETALPKVAGAANALEIPLSRVLSQLSIAQDATQDASIAGTSLRKVYVSLANKGLTLDEALNKINVSTNKLKTSYQIFGVRAAVVGLALANNTERAKELEEEYNNAGGTAERVAKTQMDTFRGSIDKMKSSWEKLILSFQGSKGVMRSTVDLLNDIINKVIFLKSDTKQGFFEKLDLLLFSALSKKGAKELFEVMNELSNFNNIIDDYRKSISELNEVELNERLIEQFNTLGQQKLAGRIEDAKLTATFIEEIKKRIIVVADLEKKADEKKRADKLAVSQQAEVDAIDAARRTENNINKELSKLREKKANAEEADAIKLTKLITAKEAELEAFLRKINENRVNMMEGIQIVANASIEAATESIADQDELAVRILEIQLKSTKDQLHMMTKMIGKKEELTNEEAAHLKHLSDQQFAYEEQLEAKKLEILTSSLSEKQKILDQEYRINLNQLKNRELSADEYNKRLLLLDKTLLVDKIKNIELELKDVEAGTVEEYKLKQDLINKKIELDILYAGSSMQNAKDLLEFRKQLDVVSNEELFEIEKQRIIESNEWKLLTEEEQQQALANLKKKYREEDEKEEENTWKKILKTIGQAIQFAEDIVTSYSDLFKYQKEKELSAVGDNAVKREAIEKKYAEKERKIEIARALINGAAAIQKTIAQWGIPWGLIPAALAAYITKEQIKAIKGAKFKTGGILQGASHEQGGIQLYGKGGYYGEAEGGEPILTKNVSRNPYLLRAASDINVAAGGKPLTSGYRFQEGGLTPTASSSSAINANLIREIVNETIAGVRSIPVTVLENDISRMQRRVSVIERQGDA